MQQHHHTAPVIFILGNIAAFASHGYATGDAVVYRNGGGANIEGLTDGTKYFVIKISDGSLKQLRAQGLAVVTTRKLGLCVRPSELKRFIESVTVEGSVQKERRNREHQLAQFAADYSGLAARF